MPSAIALRVVSSCAFPGSAASQDGGGILLLLNTGDEPYHFPVDPVGLAIAETPEPAATPDDPLLVPAHSWTILA